MSDWTDKLIQEWCEDNNVAFIPKIENPTTENEKHIASCRQKLEDLYKQEIAKKLLQNQQEIQRQQELQKQDRLMAFLASIPLRYKNASIESLRRTDITIKLLDGKNGLILSENGQGKTYLLYALAKEFVKKQESVQIVRAYTLMEDLRSNQVKNYYTTKHLLIDEIDKIYRLQQANLFDYLPAFEKFFELVDDRYNNLLQTVIVGNGTLADFTQFVGSSVYSRLCGDGGVCLETTGKDRRFLQAV